MCVCVRACVRVCVCVCVRACVRVCVHRSVTAQKCVLGVGCVGCVEKTTVDRDSN